MQIQAGIIISRQNCVQFSCCELNLIELMKVKSGSDKYSFLANALFSDCGIQSGFCMICSSPDVCSNTSYIAMSNSSMTPCLKCSPGSYVADRRRCEVCPSATYSPFGLSCINYELGRFQILPILQHAVSVNLGVIQLFCMYSWEVLESWDFFVMYALQEHVPMDIEFLLSFPVALFAKLASI